MIIYLILIKSHSESQQILPCRLDLHHRRSSRAETTLEFHHIYRLRKCYYLKKHMRYLILSDDLYHLLLLYQSIS